MKTFIMGGIVMKNLMKTGLMVMIVFGMIAIFGTSQAYAQYSYTVSGKLKTYHGKTYVHFY
jgi:hypothetical protein